MGPSDEEVRAEQLTCLKKWARNLDLEYELLLEKKRRIQGIQAVQSGDRSANSEIMNMYSLYMYSSFMYSLYLLQSSLIRVI